MRPLFGIMLYPCYRPEAVVPCVGMCDGNEPEAEIRLFESGSIPAPCQMPVMISLKGAFFNGRSVFD